ncbi:MAG: cellulase N-terminal Ig-like domain-containing protein [candidate division KSB1 bacterium]|nr:cellulase N-terminal Ig-like domain-containing protein [candidate division KSB1 bacterium]
MPRSKFSPGFYLFLAICIFLFLFNQTQAQSLSRDFNINIAINQVGYPTDAYKQCVSLSGAAEAFHVIQLQTGDTVYTGELSAANGDFGDYKTGVFTQITHPGRYYIRTHGGRSYPFLISDDVYNAALQATLNYLQVQGSVDSPVRGFFRVSRTRPHLRSGSWVGDMPLLSLCIMAETFPQHDKRDEWLSADDQPLRHDQSWQTSEYCIPHVGHTLWLFSEMHK